MSNNDVEDILTRKEVKPTSNRILVMRADKSLASCQSC